MEYKKDETKAKKVKRPRSAAYPGISLEDAVKYSSVLLTTYPNADFSRESAAEVMGHSKLTGSAARKVAALVHFGLIERKGSTYRNADLANHICTPVNDKEKNKALIEAVKTPKLFADLIQEYDGKAIPPALKNVVSRHHGINLKVADKVVDLFKASVEFAGIYENGILKSVSDKIFVSERKTMVTEKKNQEMVIPETNTIESGRKHRMIDITLPSGAVFSYPAKIGFKLQTSVEFGTILTSLEELVKKALNKK